MSETRNGLFVEYCAKDFLDGTQQLDVWEEIAYRRVVDMIYATNDALADDDRKLAWMTKVGSRWKKIRESLISAGKIEAVEGRITNARCRKELEKSAKKIAQKVGAGIASAATGKSLQNLNRHRTDVPDAVLTDDRTNYKPTNPSKEEKDTTKVVSKKLGSRLPVGFVMPEEWIEKANTARVNAGLPIADLGTEGVKFVNYWTAKSGQAATKLDWLATWINWSLNAKGNSNGRKTSGADGVVAGFAAALSRRAERDEDRRDNFDPPQSLRLV